MTSHGCLVYKDNMNRIVITAGPEDAGRRLDAFVGEKAEGISRTRARALIEQGALVAGQVEQTDPRAPVRAGVDYVLQLPPPVPALPEPEAIALTILYEDAHLIVIDKPAGLAVHPAPGSLTGTLVNALLHHCRGQLSGIGGTERPGIVHRLDKLTSGVMVAVKTQAAHVGLAELFARHDIDRMYLAVTRSAPRPLSGTIDAPVARSVNDRKKMSVHKNPDSPSARRAVTHYRTVETFGIRDRSTRLPACALVECRLETGRTHQIRVHMAHIGAPLVGDPVYARHSIVRAAGEGGDPMPGLALARDFPRQALHAALLGFRHPVTGEAMRFEAPLPDDMAQLTAALRALPSD